MDKHVLLVFSLFCCFEGAALRCITCHLHLTSDRCRRGFGICVAQKEEKCMTLKVYDYYWNLQLSYMVCQRFCRALTFHHHGRVFVHECCDHNYCNFQLTNKALVLFLAASTLFSVPGMVTSTFYLVKNVHSGCQNTTCFPQSGAVKDISCLIDPPVFKHLNQKLFLMGFFKNLLANLTSKFIIDTIIVPRSYKGNLLIWGGSSDAVGSGFALLGFNDVKNDCMGLFSDSTLNGNSPFNLLPHRAGLH